jgi:Ca2+-binding EF-hand superfamily protein
MSYGFGTVIAIILAEVIMGTKLSAIILSVPLFLAPAWLSAQSRSSDFPANDRNGDGVIDRAEWDGTRAAFRRHDGNRDGVLSGNEVPGWFYGRTNETQVSDTGRYPLGDLDRNGNGYIERREWRGRMAEFRSLDRNRDGRLSDGEYSGDYQSTRSRSADQPADRLDRNRSGAVEGYEWPYNSQLFHQLDRNGDSTLTQDELSNISGATLGQLDRNRNNVLDRDEWPGGFAQFRDLDANNDNRVTADEFFTRGGDWQRRQRFRAWDQNGDGIIQSTEWKSASDLFHRLDTNANSQIELSEFMNDTQTYLNPNRW